ncbi:TetR/AcrR family transcriptional regulator [Shimazuella kribbensis]|uniref:TetR/AcrR family transcriptional regulator n=1 Tax=Shimazuella kribbensis TaxID=139808 RepID=UPI0003F8FB09|nr:TetR/AcrR family transcriptional regulator [Shimazuella kribbensis]
MSEGGIIIIPQTNSKRPPGRPKKTNNSDLKDTEKMILYQAGCLFTKSGYAAVSISAITGAVGITKPTLYHYFPDKEHLYAAVLCERLERVSVEILKNIESNVSIREKLFSLSYGFFRYASMCMSTLMRDVDEHLSEGLVRKVHLAYEQYIVEPHRSMIRIGMKKGEIQNQFDQVEVLADIWLGLLDSLSQKAFAKKQDEAALTQLSLTVVSVFLDGVA